MSYIDLQMMVYFKGECIIVKYLRLYFLWNLLFRETFGSVLNSNLTVNVQFQEEPLSWKQANEKCKLLGADFEDVDVNEYFKNKSFGKAGYEAWIGAYTTYTKWINFAGCQFGYPYRKGIDIRSTDDPVNVCMDRCPNGFVLTSEMCYCREHVRLLSSGCLARICNDNSNSFCGSPGIIEWRGWQVSCMCNYRILQEEDNGRIGNCMTLLSSNPSNPLQNEECSKNFSSICRRGDSSSILYHKNKMNWIDAGLSCYQHNLQFHTSLVAVSGLKQTWIAIFRRSDYHWGLPNVTSIRHDCLSISVDNTGSLMIHIRKCDKRLPAICEVLPVHTTTLSTTETSMTGTEETSINIANTTIQPNLTTENVSLTFETTTSSEEVTTGMITTDFQTSVEITSAMLRPQSRLPNESISSSAIAAICSVFSTIVLFTVVVCLIVCLKHRKNNKEHESSMTTSMVVNYSSGSISALDSVYSDIEEKKNESVYNEVAETPDGSFLIDNQLYNDLHDVRPKNGPNTDYDCVHNLNDLNTYSHFTRNQNSPTNELIIKDYDTIANVRETLTGEDTYGHLQSNAKTESIVATDYDTIANVREMLGEQILEENNEQNSQIEVLSS